MNNIPSFQLGNTAYYRPWHDHAFEEAFANYQRDGIIVDALSSSMHSAAQEAAKEIGFKLDGVMTATLGAAEYLGDKFDSIESQIIKSSTGIESELLVLNQRARLLYEQIRLANGKLDEIIELLQIPDSEKERLHSIKLGMKFYINARKDPDMYKDALDEFEKALSLMSQDYFVLNKIGCIYTYGREMINLKKALESFLKSAKYASVEDGAEAKDIASDSYNNAALISYALGDDENAVKYQQKSVNIKDNPQNHFLLAKYQVRNQDVSSAIENLDLSIDGSPSMINGVFLDGDLVSSQEILDFIKTKNRRLDEEIDVLIGLMNKYEINFSQASSSILDKKTYARKKAAINKIIRYMNKPVPQVDIKKTTSN